MPEPYSKRHVFFACRKDYASPHDTDDMRKYLPAGLTQYFLNHYKSKFPPYHARESVVSIFLEYFMVENITSHPLVCGRNGVIAVLHGTHWLGIAIFFASAGRVCNTSVGRFFLTGRVLQINNFKRTGLMGTFGMVSRYASSLV